MRVMTAGVTTVLMMAAGCSMMKAKEDAAKDVKSSDLPAAVQSAVQTRLPGATYRSSEKENENGNEVYDLELTQNGRKYEMDVKPDGTVLEIEKEVAKADVPAAVMQGVQSNFPGAEVKDVMEVDKVSGNQETLQHYEVTLKGAKEKEVNISADGKIVHEE